MNMFIASNLSRIFSKIAQPIPARRRRRAVGAFTLIELLLVLVILAVLAAVVIPRMVGRGEQAKIAAAQTDISNMDTVLDAFEVDTGRYPSGQEGLEALFVSPSGLQGWKGPYLKKSVPNDPWGNPYVYRNPGQHNTEGYDLYSFGPNGQEGDTDDVTNWTK